MEATVASLLLITAAVVFACVVVGFAVNVMEQVLSGESIPELDQIRAFHSNLLNQTEQLLNQTQQPLPELPTP